MAKPSRAFRGPVEQEVQIQPLYRALQGGLDSKNAAALGFMPIGTVAGTGSEVITNGGNIGWSFAPLTFASSVAAQTVTFSHGLLRKPEFYVNVRSDPFQVAIAPVSVSSWNSTQVIFGIPNDTVANTFRILLM